MEHEAQGDRLDSWKAIAAYLRRDVATVRRWEKTLGLPVRRVPGGSGHSVFAYTSEIDAWLQKAPATEAASLPASDDALVIKGVWRGWTGTAATALLVAAGSLVAWRAHERHVSAENLHLETTPEAVVAVDAQGTERWRYSFPTVWNSLLSTWRRRAWV